MQNTGQPIVAVVIRDLIFETKIKATAASLGMTAHIVRSAPELSQLLSTKAVTRVIVDLNSAGPSVFEAIRAARESRDVSIIAFFAHIDTDLAERARDAGADEVLPRSRFVTQLPALLAGSSANTAPGPGSNNEGLGNP